MHLRTAGGGAPPLPVHWHSVWQRCNRSRVRLAEQPGHVVPQALSRPASRANLRPSCPLQPLYPLLGCWLTRPETVRYSLAAADSPHCRQVTAEPREPLRQQG